MELKLPKWEMPKVDLKNGFAAAVKGVSDTATKTVGLLDDIVEIKNAVLNANVDEHFKKFTDKKAFEEAKAKGEKNIAYLPDFAEKDFTQGIGCIVYGCKLLMGCCMAGAAKMAAKKVVK